MNKLGSKTTALEALRARSLKGKRAIVTGANSGLGLEVARVLALGGADVLLACRSLEAGERTVKYLQSTLNLDVGHLSACQLDLSDLCSVQRFSEEFAKSGRSLDLLINNAGIMAVPLAPTVQGFESQIGTNHLGHFYLTKLLAPILLRALEARIVTVSSELHRKGDPDSLLSTLSTDLTYGRRRYKPFVAYGDSKLANILFTRALSERMPSNVLALSLHPGVIATNLSRSLGVAGSVYRFAARPFLKSVAQGAATTIFAATAPELVGRSGLYLSDCSEKQPSASALDVSLANELWELSEKAILSVK